jgi:hypothetical protein
MEPRSGEFERLPDGRLVAVPDARSELEKLLQEEAAAVRSAKRSTTSRRGGR